VWVCVFVYEFMFLGTGCLQLKTSLIQFQRALCFSHFSSSIMGMKDNDEEVRVVEEVCFIEASFICVTYIGLFAKYRSLL